MTAFPIILSAPSGGGKTTITKHLLARRSDLGYSVSATTRAPRHAEADGRDYHFLSHSEFIARQKSGDFAEWAEVHGKLYGTLRSEVDRVLDSGRHVIMDIDVQGAAKFAAAYPASVLIFLVPPSAEVLIRRLMARRTEKAPDLLVRLETAKRELEAVQQYEYVVVNGDLEQAVRETSAIIDAESLRRTRTPAMSERVRGLVDGLDREIAGLRLQALTVAVPRG
jgi:guanylate kinase